MQAEFTVYGKPMGKQRPKFARRGKFTTTYTPSETVKYEKQVKIAYNKENRGVVLEGPVQVNIKGVFPIPKSVSKKKYKELINSPHTKKPDCDNLAKIILDPLNKLAYNDDGQVARLYVDKIYGEEPRVEVNLSTIKDSKIVTPAIYLLSDCPIIATFNLNEKRR